MISKNIKLTEAEWHVMECLWEQSPRTSREITHWLENQMGWNRSTTLTLLRRMEKKNVVRCDTGADLHQFFPLVTRDEVALQEAESFLERVYQGSLSLMVSSLTRKQSLPQEEIDRLYALLKEMEDNNG